MSGGVHWLQKRQKSECPEEFANLGRQRSTSDKYGNIRDTGSSEDPAVALDF
jgi:hypothetical protein